MTHRGWCRFGGAGIWLLAGLLLALPPLRSMLAERAYGAAANCGGCVRWASLGNDAWLAGLGIALLALGLAVHSRWLRTALAVAAFALALAMLVDTLLLDVLSLRLHMADVLKFGGEGQATTGFVEALLRGGYWPGLVAAVTLALILALLPLPARRAPRAGTLLALTAVVMVAGGLWLGRAAAGYIHSEGVVNIAQLQGLRGVNATYSEAFARRALAVPIAPADVCEAGQGRRPDVLVLVIESLSAYHSGLLGGRDHVPELDAVARANTWFSAFHANGFTTDHGLIALLDGRVPVPAVGRYLSMHAFAGFGDPQRSVVGTLRPAGYFTAFFTTGNLGFLDKTAWLSQMQVDHFEGSESPYYRGMPRGGFDAASDDALYGRVLQWMDDERDSSRPFFAALLTVDTHPPFLDRDTGQLDEEGVFRKADAAFGRFHRELARRGFFEHGILLVTGDHRSMTAIGSEEWSRYGDSAVARVPLVVVGASGLPKGGIDAAFQQTDLLPSLAQLTGQGRICRNSGQGAFLRAQPQPPDHVVHARGDRRGRVDVYYPDGGIGWIELAGDASTSGGAHPASTAEVAAAIHRDRIERGEVPRDMAPLLLDLSRRRLQQSD